MNLDWLSVQASSQTPPDTCLECFASHIVSGAPHNPKRIHIVLPRSETLSMRQRQNGRFSLKVANALQVRDATAKCLEYTFGYTTLIVCDAPQTSLL